MVNLLQSETIIGQLFWGVITFENFLLIILPINNGYRSVIIHMESY